MKKLLFITVVLLFFAFEGKSQVPMTVAGYDNGQNWALSSNDYWTISYVVLLYNDAHSQVIRTWQGGDLNPNVWNLTYTGFNNPFSQYCLFTMAGGIPLVLNPNYRVLVAVKRYSLNASDYVCGFEKYSGWMNSAGLSSSFTVSGVLVDF